MLRRGSREHSLQKHGHALKASGTAARTDIKVCADLFSLGAGMAMPTIRRLSPSQAPTVTIIPTMMAPITTRARPQLAYMHLLRIRIMRFETCFGGPAHAHACGAQYAQSCSSVACTGTNVLDHGECSIFKKLLGACTYAHELAHACAQSGAACLLAHCYAAIAGTAMAPHTTTAALAMPNTLLPVVPANHTMGSECAATHNHKSKGVL